MEPSSFAVLLYQSYTSDRVYNCYYMSSVDDTIFFPPQKNTVLFDERKNKQIIKKRRRHGFSFFIFFLISFLLFQSSEYFSRKIRHVLSLHCVVWTTGKGCYFFCKMCFFPSFLPAAISTRHLKYHNSASCENIQLLSSRYV